jgi:DNA polymerase-1
MDYALVTSKDELNEYLPAVKQAKVLAADIETTGLNPHTDRVRLIQLAVEGIPVLVIDCFTFLTDGLDLLRDVLEGSGVKIFQNAKFDLQFFLSLGIHPAPVFDTMLAGQLLRTSGGPYHVNLAALARHYLDEDIGKDEQKSDWSGTLTESQLRYAARDADVLLRLREVMVKEIHNNGLAMIAKIEFACVHAIARMEYTGISLDRDRWHKLTIHIEQERDAALEVLYTYAGQPMAQTSLLGEDEVIGHNFDSNPFVVELLRSHGIEADAASKRALSSHTGHPLIQAVSAYRKAAKALSSFLYPMPPMIRSETGRLHPRYGQIGAWSGRMSCGGPNIQQIPRDAAFRACFVAPPGRKLIVADYSQIELRVAAQISGDRRMTDAYRKGEDLHALTASLVSDVPPQAVTKAQRQAAKAVNFGLIFGMGAAGLQQYAQQSYGVDMTLEQAAGFRDGFFKAYPGIAAWHRHLRDEKPAEGRSLTGRRFTYGENAGLSGLANTPVQGTAADIMKAALGTLARRVKGTDIRMIAAVHDEIILEAGEQDAGKAAELLRDTMERAGNRILADVPCAADVAVSDTWAG